MLVQCQNALYGTMVEGLIYYGKFTNSFTDVGFKINLYKVCVANNMIDGQQMTICYHVDNFKFSHCRRKLNDQMFKRLRQEDERIFEDGSGKMTVCRVKVHKYLGMTLDNTLHGQVQITMIDFLDKFLVAFYKAELRGALKKQVQQHRIYLRCTKIYRSSNKLRL